jgi:hypothetical protein
VPDPALLRAVHSTALHGGVLGWVLGVLVRAGPMFVVDWQVPPRLLALLPWATGLSVACGVAAVTVDATAAPVLGRLGDLLALGTAAAVVVASGALRRARRALPMLSRGAAEGRLFRLAAVSVVVGAPAAAALTLVAARFPHPLLADALRHLFTVGFVTTVIVAMVLRLIPVLEGTAIPWPRVPSVALVGLVAAVVLRSAQSLEMAYAGPAVRLAVALSGLLVWLVLAATGASLLVAMSRR